MLSSDPHVLTPLSPLLSPDREIRDALDRERVRADMAEARVAELEGKLCDALNSAREWKAESITARCGLNTLQATFKSNRKKLASVRKELKDLRRSQSARTVRRLERDNARLSAILKSSEIYQPPIHNTVLSSPSIPQILLSRFIDSNADHGIHQFSCSGPQ